MFFEKFVDKIPLCFDIILLFLILQNFMPSIIMGTVWLQSTLNRINYRI